MNVTEPALTPEQIAEIEKHKYFLSEKAGHDVGWEFAEQDWREKYLKSSDSSAEHGSGSPQPTGLGRFFKRLLSKAASA